MSKEIGRYHSLNIHKIYPYAQLVILLIALILGLIGLNKGLWNDEYFTIRKISHPSIFDMFDELKKDVHPPLYYILLYYWGKISKQEEFLRLFSVFLSIGTLGVVTSWIKQYSPLASLLAGVYLATTPIMLRYSQELKAYSLVVFATSLAFLFASYIIAKPEKYFGYIGLAFSLTVAVSAHLVGIMLIPAILFFLMAQRFLHQKNIQLLKLAGAIIIPTIVFSYFKFFWLNQIQEIQDTWWWMPRISWHLISSTARYLFGLSSLYLPTSIIPWLALIFSGLLVIAIFFGQGRRTSFPFIVAAIIFWFVILAYSIYSPILYYRILLPGLVPFVAFLALQIATIRVDKIKISAIVCLIILSLSYTANWVTNQAYKPVEENREVARLVESEWQPNNLLVFYPPFIQGTVNYYLKNLPSEAQIAVWETNNIQVIEQEINAFVEKSRLEIKAKPIDIFVVVMTGKIEGYNDLLSNLISVIKSKQPKELTIHLFLIKGHDTYFSNQLASADKFLDATESKLGKSYSYQDFGLYVTSKYKI